MYHVNVYWNLLSDSNHRLIRLCRCTGLVVLSRVIIFAQKYSAGRSNVLDLLVLQRIHAGLSAGKINVITIAKAWEWKVSCRGGYAYSRETILRRNSLNSIIIYTVLGSWYVVDIELRLWSRNSRLPRERARLYAGGDGYFYIDCLVPAREESSWIRGSRS